MSTTKKVLLVIGIVVLLLVIGLGVLIYKGVQGSPEVQNTLTSFLASVSAGNMTNAYALTTKAFQQSISEPEFVRAMQQDKPQYSGFKGLAQTGFRVVANAGQPVMYEYSGSITYDNGDVGQVAATLLDEGGYKVQGVNVTITPARLAEFK